MVISDFNILCISQTEITVPPFDKILIEVNDYMYKDEWRAVQKIKGIWYSISPIERKWYDYDHEFFDIDSIKFHKCNNKNSEYWNSNYTVSFENGFTNIFSDLIKYYIDKSPCSMICVLLRIDGTNTEILIGDIKLDSFLEMANKNDLKFNVAYIVEK